ncbi:MAG: NADase-type glycan-binding domain-containing protein [Nitrospinota bacterium]
MKIIIVTILASLIGTNAFANGGPVDWTGVTPLGGIRLNPVKDIHLDKEELDIKLLDNLNDYSVIAKYHLNNTGEKTKILFGIPLSWMGNAGDVFEATKAELTRIEKERKKKIAKTSALIKLMLNGVQIKCKPAELSRLQSNDSYPKQLKTKNWCVTNLSLKKGRNSLVMKYNASMFYNDSAFTKSVFTVFEQRNLMYELFPAGYWDGNLRELKIKIDLGDYTDFVDNISPKKYKQNGNILEWNFKDVDLKKLQMIDITFKTTILNKNEIARWNKIAHKYQTAKMIAKSSSTLAPSKRSSYQASNILDGDPKTAWCEGNKNNGVEEYLELRPQDGYFEMAEKYCNIEGISILPGYLKSQSTYTTNNRISKVGISDCKGKNNVSFDIDLAKDYRLAPVVLENFDRVASDSFYATYRSEFILHGEYHDARPKPQLAFIENTDCIKIEILEVKSGKVEDACISELSLIINCG